MNLSKIYALLDQEFCLCPENYLEAMEFLKTSKICSLTPKTYAMVIKSLPTEIVLELEDSIEESRRNTDEKTIQFYEEEVEKWRQVFEEVNFSSST